MNNIYLKSGKEESLKRFHPWVFSGAISRIEGGSVHLSTRLYRKGTLSGGQHHGTRAYI